MDQSGKGKTLLQLIDRKKFDELCEKWRMDKGVRSFSTWEQTCVHVMAYVMKLESLREIESVLFVPRSTFSDANANRSAGFFEELCDVILLEIQKTTKSRKIRKAIKRLLALDSSEIKVHGSLGVFPKWHQKSARGRSASAKFHAVWDVDGQWIEDFRVTPGKNGDSIVGKQFEILAGVTYVFDRAYNDLAFWWSIVEKGSHFVSRLKDSPRRRIFRKILLEENRNKDRVLWDGKWKPTDCALFYQPGVPKDIEFRHIIYRDPETKKVFDFVTSDFDSATQFITDTYRKRWAVELLFRWLKGHLNIRYLAVKNRNAVKTQLAIAVLVQLLVQLYKTANRLTQSLWQCLRAHRMGLVWRGLAEIEFPADTRWRTLSEANLTL